MSDKKGNSSDRNHQGALHGRGGIHQRGSRKTGMRPSTYEHSHHKRPTSDHQSKNDRQSTHSDRTLRDAVPPAKKLVAIVDVRGSTSQRPHPAMSALSEDQTAFEMLVAIDDNTRAGDSSASGDSRAFLVSFIGTQSSCVVRDNFLVACKVASRSNPFVLFASPGAPFIDDLRSIVADTVPSQLLLCCRIVVPIATWATWQTETRASTLPCQIIASTTDPILQKLTSAMWVSLTLAPPAKASTVSLAKFTANAACTGLRSTTKPCSNVDGNDWGLEDDPEQVDEEQAYEGIEQRQQQHEATEESGDRTCSSGARPIETIVAVATEFVSGSASEEHRYARQLAEFLTRVVAQLCCDGDVREARRLFYRDGHGSDELNPETIVLWVDAFTHISYSPHCYESLEYFGDRVLKTAFAYYMFQKFPDVRECEISTAERLYVSKVTQAKICKKLCFAPWIRRRNVPLTVGMTEDVFESFFGALARSAELTVRPELGGSGEVFARRALKSLFDKHLSIDLVDVKDSQNLVKEAYEAFRVEHPVHVCTQTQKSRFGALQWTCRLFELEHTASTSSSQKRTRLISVDDSCGPVQTFTRDDRTVRGYCIASGEGPSIESAVKRAYANAVHVLEASGRSQRDIRLRRMKNRLDPLGEIGEKALQFAQEMNFEAMKFQEVKSVSGSIDTDCVSSEWRVPADLHKHGVQESASSLDQNRDKRGVCAGTGNNTPLMRMMVIIWGFRSIADDQRQIPIFLARGVVVHHGHSDRQHLAEIANRQAIENLVAEFERPITSILRGCSWLQVRTPLLRIEHLAKCDKSDTASSSLVSRTVELPLEHFAQCDDPTACQEVVRAAIGVIDASLGGFHIEICDRTTPSVFSAVVWGSSKVRPENVSRGLRMAALRAMEMLRCEGGLDYGSRTVHTSVVASSA